MWRDGEVCGSAHLTSTVDELTEDRRHHPAIIALHAPAQARDGARVAPARRQAAPVIVNRTRPAVAPPPVAPSFSNEPTDEEIVRARLFAEPLVPIGQTTRLGNRTLVYALTEYLDNRQLEAVAPLNFFLLRHRASPWRASLLLNLEDQGGVALQYRFIEATDPLGGTERLEYRGLTVGMAASAPAAHVPTGFEAYNEDLNLYNTFYWGKQVLALGPPEDATATITHWLLNFTGAPPRTPARSLAGTPTPRAALSQARRARLARSAAGSRGTTTYRIHVSSRRTASAQGLMYQANTDVEMVPHSVKRPLEHRVWYTYPGQTLTTYIGWWTEPTAVGRVLDDGASQITRATYTTQGLVTSRTDPLGRETTYIYAANGIDLLEVRQTTGSLNDLVASYGNYDSRHRPGTLTDAAGQTTPLTYNTAGQVLTSTNAKQETTTSGYGADGRLQSVTGPVAGATTTYTYDAYGRVATVTDADGGTIATEYDALNRVRRITYPDGTSEEAVYDRLEVGERRDHRGRVTRYFYDPLRRLVATRDHWGARSCRNGVPVGASAHSSTARGR